MPDQIRSGTEFEDIFGAGDGGETESFGTGEAIAINNPLRPVI